MSFWNRGSTNTPPPASNQPSQGGGYNALPSGPRPGAGRPNPAGNYGAPPDRYGQPAQYNPPPAGYNDPNSALFEKRAYEGRAPPSSGGAAGYGGRVAGGGGGGGEKYAVVSVPNETLALTNCLVTHPSDFPDGTHVLINGTFGLTTKSDNTRTIQPRSIGTSAGQRQWIGLSKVGDFASVDVMPRPPNPNAPAYLQSIDIEIGFQQRGYDVAETFSPDEMQRTFVSAYGGIILSTDQIIFFEFHGHALKGNVKGTSVLELADEQRRGAAAAAGGQRAVQNRGIVMEKTDINFIKAASSPIKIKSSAKRAPANAILTPNFKFEDMGIGGLDNEFSDIFRRAFSSRVFPPGLVEKLGIQHVKGILLHGPPGTGKTLIARQIGKMLNAREPKVVNGPEILSKYVGASEENIRKLFADAEKEYKEKGDESGLHIIIFDELDAIFKQRGSTNNGTGVGDTVVNQLLSKMDGVDQLNNILIIGMTNRKDMIDEALLRPGRLEVHMEISLPDEGGRYQILHIHTSKMRTNKVLDPSVDLHELASLTKNFSGAEIGGLIKSATSFAFNRHVKVGTMAGISDDVEHLMVNRDDFLRALDEVHPAFGVSEEELAQVMQNGIIHFNSTIEEILRSGKLFVDQVRTSQRTPLVSVLLHGPAGSGKTALSASIAQLSEFPFIKLISPDTMVGFGELQKVNAINKVFADSYKSPLSVIVVDNVERLIDWTPMGARFSNTVLQALLVLLGRRPPKGRRLLILVTTSLRPVLTDLGFSELFDSELRVPPITHLREFEAVIRDLNLFGSQEEEYLRTRGMLLRAGFAPDDEAGGLEDELDNMISGYSGGGGIGGEGKKLNIGVKKLLSMVEMARQEPESVAERLTSALMGLGM